MSEAQADGGSPIRAIFICTGNATRSQMAEAIMRREGAGAFETVSAGIHPKPIDPLTVRSLANVGIDIGDARSKSVDEFINQPFDYVITVCDIARQTCPVFPGGRETLHWGFDDPADAEGTDEERMVVFDRVLGEISRRTRQFIPLALKTRDDRLATAGSVGGGS